MSYRIAIILLILTAVCLGLIVYLQSLPSRDDPQGEDLVIILRYDPDFGHLVGVYRRRPNRAVITFPDRGQTRRVYQWIRNHPGRISDLSEQDR